MGRNPSPAYLELLAGLVEAVSLGGVDEENDGVDGGEVGFPHAACWCGKGAGAESVS